MAAARNVGAAVRRDIRSPAALIRSAVCVVEKVIRRRSVISGTVLAYEDTKGCKNDSDAAISGEEEEAFMYDNPGECSDVLNDGAVVRLLGRYGISRLSAIIGQCATPLIHQPE